MSYVRYLPYVGKGLQWLEFIAEQTPYWPSSWPKPSTWAEHKLEKALEYLAENEGRAFDAEAFGRRVGMSFTPQQKRKGTLPRGYIDARKKARLDSDDAEGVARNLAPEFEMAAVGGGALGQRKQYRKKLGRKKSMKAMMTGLTKTALQNCVVRYQDVNSYENPGLISGTAGGTGSYYNLCHRQATGTTGEGREAVYPVHLFDLTCVNKTCKPLGTVKPTTTYRINPMWHLGSDASGNFEWNQCGIQAQGITGVRTVNDARWYIEQTTKGANTSGIYGFNDGNSALPIGQRAFLRWSDIRLQFLGARAIPTNVDVYIVKFKDPDFDPYTNGRTYNQCAQTFANGTTISTTTGTLDSDKRQEWNSYCKAWLKPKIFNPLDVQYTQASDKFKILYHKRVSFKPDTSTNLDVNRATSDCKVFHRFDRMFNFNWDDQINVATGGGGGTAENIFPQNVVTVNGETGGEMDLPTVQQYVGTEYTQNPYVAPNSRVYLMIVAEDYKDKSLFNPYTTKVTGDAGTVWADPVGTALSTGNQTFDGTVADTTSYNIVLRNKWMWTPT